MYRLGAKGIFDERWSGTSQRGTRLRRIIIRFLKFPEDTNKDHEEKTCRGRRDLGTGRLKDDGG